MKVSFIVPYYNEDVGLLRQAIESILALSLRPEEREVIVVDDGSDVSPEGELERYGADVVLLTQENGGLSKARNTGLDRATGDFIQFVDADDCLLPPLYDRCLDVARTNDADMVMFRFTRKPLTLAPSIIPRGRAPHEEPLRGREGPWTGAGYMLSHNLHGSACTCLFRRNLLQELRFTEGRLQEDEEFTPQLVVRSKRLYILAYKAYFYRERQGSITYRADEEWLARRLDDMEHIIVRLQGVAAGLDTPARQAMERRVGQLTMDHLYNTILMTRSMEALNKRIDRLRKEGLFPLPMYCWTMKYTLFSLLVNNPFGRRLLLEALPMLKR